MNRRSFLAALGVAPVAAAIAKPETAEATFRMASGYTTSSGWTSGMGVQTRVGDGSAFRSAGLYLDASAAGQSRILFDASRFEIGQNRPDNLVELVQIA